MPKIIKFHHMTIHQTADVFLFIGAVILGFSGMIISKYYDIDPLSAAVIPAVILISYAILSWVKPRFRLEPETIGDNCYYLGFIFTLLSLALTLYALNRSSEEEADLIREIVSGFGVALSSTIVGIILRVLCIQFRPDVVTSDLKARIELNQAVREFKVELSQSSMRFREFSREVEQSLSEQRGYFEAADNERMERQAEWLKNHSETVAKEMVGAVNYATDTILKSVQERFNEASKDWAILLDTTSDHLAKTVDNYSSRLNATSGKAENTAEQLSASIGQMREAIETSSEAINTAGIQVAERVSHIAENISKLEENFKVNISAPLSEMVNENERIAKSVSAFGHDIDMRLQEIAKNFEQVATTVTNASTALGNTSMDVQTFIAELNDNPRSDAMIEGAQLKTLEDAIRDMSDTLRAADRLPGHQVRGGGRKPPKAKSSKPVGWWRGLWG